VLDEVHEVPGEERRDTALGLVLGDVAKLVAQQHRIAIASATHEDRVAEREPGDVHLREAQALCGGPEHRFVGQGHMVHDHNANARRIGDADGAGQRPHPRREGPAASHRVRLLLLRPSHDAWRQDRHLQGQLASEHGHGQERGGDAGQQKSHSSFDCSLISEPA
jgi:hypothetical protein